MITSLDAPWKRMTFIHPRVHWMDRQHSLRVARRMVLFVSLPGMVYDHESIFRNTASNPKNRRDGVDTTAF